MGRLTLGIAVLFFVFGVAACGGDDPDTAASVADPTLSTPKGSIAYQLGLLKAGKVDELKACFTVRLQDGITAEAVAEGAAGGEGMTIDKIFASSEESEFEGKKTVKVKMENGRTLTTLVLTDGKWLADTIWFK